VDIDKGFDTTFLPKCVLLPHWVRRNFMWNGLDLRLGRRVLATVEPYATWSGMWRARCGSNTSDMANLTRVKDAAALLALTGHERAAMAARNVGARPIDPAVQSPPAQSRPDVGRACRLFYQHRAPL